jgi:hypothetical protein
MSPTGFERRISAGERLQTELLGFAATVTGRKKQKLKYGQKHEALTAVLPKSRVS